MLSAAEDILKHDHQNATIVETKCLDKITFHHCIIMMTGAVLLADIPLSSYQIIIYIFCTTDTIRDTSLHNMLIASIQLFNCCIFLGSCNVFNRSGIC
ncbi:putative integral membrane protein [Acanthocheilonema viteae]